MVIRTNISALRTYRAGTKLNSAMKKNVEKLSTGYRINRSADDASGLAVSERMRFNITELQRCHSNAQEGVNLAKTADGALAEVNDMLRRARELCIQAENGTYSEQELASISDEMNQLFSEIDRITEASTFNEIRLFRGEVEPDFHYEYDENFSPVDGEPVDWGEMVSVQAKPFDPPEPAKPATLTFTLNQDIDLNDVKTLNGCSFQIRSPYNYTYSYCFTDGTSPLPSGTIPVSLNFSSVEQALEYVAQRIGLPMQFDPSSRTVTFTASLQTLSYTANGLGFTAANGNGSWANGQYSISSLPGSASLNQVDGQSAANNRPVYAGTVYGTFNLSHLNRALTADDIKNLQGNTLSVDGNSIALGNIVTSGMTGDGLGAALAARINGMNGLTASYDTNTHTLSIEKGVSSSTSPSSLSISEYVTSSTGGTSPTYKEVDGTSWTSSGMSFTFNRTQEPSSERPEVCEITIPSVPSGPFSFTVNGSTYLYYNSDSSPLTYDDFNLTKYSPSYLTRINTKGMTEAQIIADIAGRIKSGVGSNGVEINGNKVTVTGTQANVSMNLSGRFSATKVTVTPYKRVQVSEGTPATPGTSQVLRPGSYYSYTQGVQVPFEMPSEESIRDLAGSGFGIAGRNFEFVNGSGTGKSGSYTDIDISGCTSYAELEEAVQKAMGNGYTVTIDRGKLSISWNITNGSSYSPISVTDGLTGVRSLMEENSVSTSGGTNIGHPQAEIDFSSINSGNLNDLLGKGFRVTCATCKGEYINVFFCWENNGRAPESLEIVDEDGETRTIHNIAVELSKVSSGDQIVQSIVDQVRPTLKHFTDVDVGPSSTTLLAQDKRRGNEYIGSILSGLKTNFNYSVNIRKVDNYPEDGSVAMKNTKVEIYVGSEPDPQIIPIHLPYIDLETLRLRPPETVDLNASDQSASDWLGRVDQANLAISKARGVIGADYNRLEYALQSLSNARENLVDAESRIRDTDMAEEMMEYVKLQILTQSQQSMLSQACSQPQQVLKLVS